jgi:dual specificity tyrosine-phosphorylation-regulated kinase 2/3/4
MNKNSYPVSWRSWASQTKISLTKALARGYFLVSLPFHCPSKGRLFSGPADNHGGPRPVVNSKGRRRRPGTKSLAQVLRCSDDDFVDFISKCLTWDPEKRIKPQAAMRHPFVTSGRRTRVISPSPAKALLSSTSLSSRTKQMTETPKKSQISAPTPLAARSSRTATNAVPSTPSNSSVHSSTLGSSRSFRSTRPQGLSTSHFSSRTLNGYAVSLR